MSCDCMRLPMPNADDIRAFKLLYARKTGKVIGDDEAREAATHLLHFIYLTRYAIHTIQSEE